MLNSSNDFSLTANEELLKTFKEIFKDLYEDNIRDEAFSEHFNVSFWMCFKNNSQSSLKATLEYTVNGKKETSSVRYEKTNTGAWQQVVIPINLGLNQLSLSSIKLLFEGCANDTQIQIADLRIMKCGTPETYIFSGTGEEYKELILKMDTSFYYYSNGGIKTRTISPDFYMTANDIFLTYKSLFYSKQNNETYYDLVYNNGTKIEPVVYAGINDNVNNFNFFIDGNDIPNYYFKLVDIIEDGTWSIMEKQICFHYDMIKLKYYYETKTMIGTTDERDSITKRLSDESSNITYIWQNADGTLRAQKDTRKIITENFYDSYGNTESVETFKEGNRDVEVIKTEYTYSTTVESQRENPVTCSKNGMEIGYEYDIESKISSTSINGNKIYYNYDSMNENIVGIKFEDNSDNLIEIQNSITSYLNSNIKSVDLNKEIIYGFKYNIFNELEKVYINKELIVEYFKNKNKSTGEVKEKIKYNNSDNYLIYSYDNMGRLIEIEDGDTLVKCTYEKVLENVLPYSTKIKQINDGYSNNIYDYEYENTDIISKKITINNDNYIKSSSNNSLLFKFGNDSPIEFFIKNVNGLNKKISNSKYQYQNNTESKLLEDFDSCYEYDNCGRLSGKSGTITTYNECQECEAAGGVSCGQIDGVKVDKKITYHHGTNFPKKYTYNVISKGIHTSDEVAEFYYENSSYDNQGNVTSVIEGGSRFKENPKNANLR